MSDQVYVRVSEPDRIDVEVTELRNRVTVSEDSLQAFVALTGVQGAAGATILSGSGAPTNAVGNEGDIYIDLNTPPKFYGPKTTSWPAEPFFEFTNNRRYIFDQPVPESTWSITHDLGGYPSVTVVDSANTVVIGDVTYINDTDITVSFTGGFSGKAFLT